MAQLLRIPSRAIESPLTLDSKALFLSNCLYGKLNIRLRGESRAVANLQRLPVMSRNLHVLVVCLTASAALAADAPMVESLARQLRSDDYDVQRQAVDSLTRLAHTSEEARSALAAAMDDPDEWVRICAVRAWRRSGGDPNKVIPLLTDAEDHVRFAVARELIQANRAIPASVSALLELQQNGSGFNSYDWEAEELFLSFGPQAADAAVPVLLDTLRKDDHRVRDAALAGLRKLGPLAAGQVPHLMELLQHNNEDVQIAAAELLGQIGEQARDAIPALRECLASPDWRFSLTAAAALGTISPQDQTYLPVLVRALGSPIHDVRAEAAGHLITVGRGAQGVIPALIDCLHDTRYGPAVALVHIGRPAVPELVRILPTHKEAKTRQQAASILGELGPDKANPDVIQALRRATQDPDLTVRAEAITALGAIGEKALDAVPLLTAALEHHDKAVRRAAMRALARMGRLPESALESLLEAIGDNDPNVCRDSLEIIQEMQKSAAPAIPRLVEALALKGGVVAGFGGSSNANSVGWALSAIGPAAVPALTTALNDRNPQVRGLAARTLGEVGPQAAPAVEQLVERLSDSGEYELQMGCMLFRATVSETAIEALGGIGPPAKLAIPHLLEILKQKLQPVDFDDDYHLQKIVEALRSIAPRNPAVVFSLTEMLQESEQKGLQGKSLCLKRALLKIDPNSPKTAQYVRDVLADFEQMGEDNFWESDFETVCNAIVQLGPQGNEFHPLLRRFIATEPLLHPRYRCIAAAALLRIDQHDREARSYLERSLKSESVVVRDVAQSALKTTR